MRYVLSVLTATVLLIVSCDTRGIFKVSGYDIDSLVGNWSELVHEGHFEETIESAGRYWRLADETSDEILKIYSGLYLGQAYTDIPDSMDYYFNKILPLVEKHGLKKLMLVIYNGNAIYSMNTLLDYNSALFWFHKALEITYDQEDRLNHAVLLCNMVDVYYEKRDTSGLQYAMEAYREAQELDNDYIRFYASLSCAQMYYTIGDYRKSLKFLDEASEVEMYSTHTDLLYAKNYRELGMWDEAETCFMRIFRRAEPFPSQTIIEAYTETGRFFCETGRNEAAIAYLDRGIQLSLQTNNKRCLVPLYETLSEVYRAIGNDREAEDYRTKGLQMRDTLNTIDKERQFGLLRLQYQEAISQVDSQRLTFKNQKLRIIMMFSSLVFISILSSVLIYLKKKKRRYRELTLKYEEKRAVTERLSQEIDRLKSLEINKDEKTGPKDKESQKSEELFNRLESLMRTEKLWRDKNLSRQSIADRLGSNTAYISKCISDCTGDTLSTYVNKYRIDDAIRLLSDPGRDLPMKAVADIVGYSSLSSFYNVFQKETGVPPKQYRDVILARSGYSK